MLNAINSSVEHLCKDVLGLELSLGKSFGKNFYGSSISLMSNSKEAYYYLFLKKDTLNEFAKSFLGVDELNEDELNDMVKEISNLIVGRAKSRLNDENPSIIYKLGTPEFLGKVSYPFPIKLDEYAIYKFKNRTFVLGVKH